METVPVRDLRNHTKDVIERVRLGGEVTLTANGKPIASIVPIREGRRYLTRQDVVALPKADPALRADLAAMGDLATDTVGPI